MYMDIQYIPMDMRMAATFPTELTTIGFETLAGTASEVRRKLDAAGDDQVVAFTMEHGNKKLAKAVEEAIQAIAPLVLAAVARREQQALETIVDALVPQVPPPQHLLAEARMNAEARKHVLETADWLTAAQLSEIAGFSGQNASAQPNKWKREGRIFAIRRNGSDYYPGYALDPDSGYRPAKGLAPILALFDGELDAWDVAIWFASVNSFLDGKIPKDLLLGAPDRVLAAAQDEVAGVLHG